MRYSIHSGNLHIFHCTLAFLCNICQMIEHFFRHILQSNIINLDIYFFHSINCFPYKNLICSSTIWHNRLFFTSFVLDIVVKHHFLSCPMLNYNLQIKLSKNICNDSLSGTWKKCSCVIYLLVVFFKLFSPEFS